MAYPNENLNKVRQTLRTRRAAALATAKAHLEELHEKYPDIAAIDSALAQTGSRLVAAIGLGACGIEERVAVLREENLRLQQDRADLLLFHSYPADYSEVHYICPACQDTGFQGTTMCHCMKKELALLGLESAGIAGMAKKATFDSFSLSYYQGEERAVMEKSLALCQAYADSFSPDAGSLLLLGPTGLGKTHLSCAMAVKIIEAGYHVVYQSAPALFAAMEAEKFGRTPQTPPSLFFEADLLIIDDLGVETPGNLNINFIYHLINDRMVNARPTIISTNLTPSALEQRYTDRIASRLLGEYRVVRFVGSDIRMQRLNR